MQALTSSAPTDSTAGMIKATRNSEHSCRGAKALPSNPYPCFGPRSPHWPNFFTLLTSTQGLWHTLSLKGAWPLLQHGNWDHQGSFWTTHVSVYSSTPMCVCSNFMLLSLPRWSSHTGLSVPYTRQAQSHLRDFAPAVFSAWNAPPSGHHMLAPPCYSVFVRFSQTHPCKVVSQALHQFTQNSLTFSKYYLILLVLSSVCHFKCKLQDRRYLSVVFSA